MIADRYRAVYCRNLYSQYSARPACFRFLLLARLKHYFGLPQSPGYRLLQNGAASR